MEREGERRREKEREGERPREKKMVNFKLGCRIKDGVKFIHLSRTGGGQRKPWGP